MAEVTKADVAYTMVKKGYDNYKNKIPTMVKNYESERTKELAIKDYSKYPFKKELKENYEKAWDTMPSHYASKMTEKVADKWAVKYTIKAIEDDLVDTVLRRLGLA